MSGNVGQKVPFVDWLRVRNFIEGMTLREATLWVGVGAFFHFFINVFFLQDNAIYSLAIAMLIWAGVWMAAAFLGAVLALPGWLIRGRYQFKVNMIGMLVCSMAGAVVEPCRLLALSSVGKLIAVPCLIAFTFIATLSSLFPFFSSLTPDRWAPKLGKICLGLSILAALSGLQPVISQNESERGRVLFSAQRGSSIKMLAGKTVTLDAMSDALADFAKAQEASRKPSLDLAVLDAPPDLEAAMLSRVPAAANAAATLVDAAARVGVPPVTGSSNAPANLGAQPAGQSATQPATQARPLVPALGGSSH